MDSLYQTLRNGEYNRRLEISRNFVRILVEQESFTPQDSNHQVQRAQLASLRLKDLLAKQNKEQEAKQTARRAPKKSAASSYASDLADLQNRFLAAHNM